MRITACQPKSIDSTKRRVPDIVPVVKTTPFSNWIAAEPSTESWIVSAVRREIEPAARVIIVAGESEIGRERCTLVISDLSDARIGRINQAVGIDIAFEGRRSNESAGVSLNQIHVLGCNHAILIDVANQYAHSHKHFIGQSRDADYVV